MRHPRDTSPTLLDSAFDDWPDEHYAPAPRAPAPAHAPAPATATVAAPPSPMAAAPAPIPSNPAPAPIEAEGEGREPISPTPPMPNADKTGRYPALTSRGAMFGCRAIGAGSRAVWTPIPNQGTVELQLRGPILSMAEKDAFEIAIDLAKEAGVHLGEEFRAPLREFARRMGMTEGGAELGAIHSRLVRLNECEARIGGTGWMAEGPLLASLRTAKGSLRMSLHPRLMSAALAFDKQFAIDSARRRSLRTPLARWLHDYFSTHAKALDVDLPYLRELSGHPGREKDFAAELREAMVEIRSLGPAGGLAPLVESFDIKGESRSARRWKLRHVRGPGSIPVFTPAKSPADASKADKARRLANPL